MKQLLILFALILFASCSKDDDPATPTPSDPELKMWVYSNFKYPVLKVWDDTVLTTEINNDPNNRNDVTPVYYERSTLPKGPYIFSGASISTFNPELMLDSDTVWVRLVVEYKGQTIIDTFRKAFDFQPTSAYIHLQDTIQ